MGYRKDPLKMWLLSHKQNSAITAFFKAAAHSTIAQLRYTTQMMLDYFAKRELCLAQLAYTNFPADKGRQMSMFVESFRD